MLRKTGRSSLQSKKMNRIKNLNFIFICICPTTCGQLLATRSSQFYIMLSHGLVSAQTQHTTCPRCGRAWRVTGRRLHCQHLHNATKLDSLQSSADWQRYNQYSFSSVLAPMNTNQRQTIGDVPNCYQTRPITIITLKMRTMKNGSKLTKATRLTNSLQH